MQRNDLHSDIHTNLHTNLHTFLCKPYISKNTQAERKDIGDHHSSTLNIESILLNVSCPSRQVSVSQPFSLSHSDSPR